MSKEEIVEWAGCIEAALPNLDPMALCWLVDEMLIGRYPLDKQAGIQNLIHGVQTVEKVGESYQFRVDFPG